jgi:hypothetical protein
VLSRHPAFALYVLVVGWLLIGALSAGDVKPAMYMLAFATSLLMSYIALCWVARNQRFTSSLPLLKPHILRNIFRDQLLRERLLLISSLGAILFSLVHYFFFEGFTLLDAITSENNNDVALIRQFIYVNKPYTVHYLSSIVIKAIFPISLLLAAAQGRTLLCTFLFVFGSVYMICMLQKAHIITFLLPLGLYYISLGRLRPAALIAVFATLVVMLLGQIANPQTQPTQLRDAAASARAYLGTSETLREKRTQEGHGQSLSVDTSNPTNETGRRQLSAGSSAWIVGAALAERLVLTPGQVVAQWIHLIPDRLPYGLGCGYRFLAPVLNCEFRNFSVEIYRLVYPEYVREGLIGTVNAASMMDDYANFGVLGLLVSGFIHALIFLLIQIIFKGDLRLVLPVNGLYILLLTSGSWTSIMASGGWAAAILMYLCLRPTPSRIASVRASLDSSPGSLRAEL